MTPTGPIKVLIVDDSPMVRSIMSRVLAEAPDIKVVATAAHPYEARDRIIEHRPDVIISDIEMPHMDGLTFLRKLRTRYPVPVIVCSSVTPSNSELALSALEAGAIDVVLKPSGGGAPSLRRLGVELAEKVRAAAVARPRPAPPTPPAQPRPG